MLIRNLLVSGCTVITSIYIGMLVKTLMRRILEPMKATGVGVFYFDLFSVLYNPVFWLGTALLVLVSLYMTGGLPPYAPPPPQQ